MINIAEQSRTVSMKLIALFIFHAIDVHECCKTSCMLL